MRIRWLGNSCIEVQGRRHILIDPNFILEPEGKADYILVTHEHPDHFKVEALNYGNKILAPSSVIEEFGIKAIVVKEGMKIEIISVVKSYCWKSKESVGYLIKNKYTILHLGDSFKGPFYETDIIFTPIFRGHHDEIVEMVAKSKAKCAIPIHFKFDDKAKIIVAEKLVEKFKRKLNIGSIILKPGKWYFIEELMGEVSPPP